MIVLDKSNPTRKIDLTKTPDIGEISIQLNWSQAKPGLLGGLFGSKKPGVDLDLGCLYELADGRKLAVQALGNAFGRLDQAPYIALDGDDRTGANQDGEWLRINGRHWPQIKRVLVYAFIYEGVANWSATDGTVTVRIPGQPPLQIRLEGTDNRQTFCVAALLENEQGQIKVTRVDRYLSGHKEADQAFAWGLNWQAGHK